MDAKFLCFECNCDAPLWAWTDGDVCELCVPLTQEEIDEALQSTYKEEN